MLSNGNGHEIAYECELAGNDRRGSVQSEAGSVRQTRHCVHAATVAYHLDARPRGSGTDHHLQPRDNDFQLQTEHSPVFQHARVEDRRTKLRFSTA